MNAATPEDRIATRKNAMTPFNFLRRTCAFSLAGALMLHSAFSVADDTEIFFGTEPGEGIKPNVLFILDDSGSMNSCTRQDSKKKCIATRMSDLQLTMNNLLNTTSGINVGLMVLNNSARSAGDAAPAATGQQYRQPHKRQDFQPGNQNQRRRCQPLQRQQQHRRPDPGDGLHQ